MPSQNLNYFSFAFEREIDDNDSTTARRRLGFFYARASTVRFFDIAANATSYYQKTRRGYTRTNVLADGTTLGNATGGTITVAEHPFTVKAKPMPRGQKITLKTGKRTSTTANAQGPFNYHTVSFNFPRWVTGTDISDILAGILPDAKVKPDAGNDDVFPYIILPTGGRVPILTVAAATARGSATPVTAANRTEILARNSATTTPTQAEED